MAFVCPRIEGRRFEGIRISRIQSLLFFVFLRQHVKLHQNQSPHSVVEHQFQPAVTDAFTGSLMNQLGSGREQHKIRRQECQTFFPVIISFAGTTRIGSELAMHDVPWRGAKRISPSARGKFHDPCNLFSAGVNTKLLPGLALCVCVSRRFVWTGSNNTKLCDTIIVFIQPTLRHPSHRDPLDSTVSPRVELSDDHDGTPRRVQLERVTGDCVDSSSH